jgi:NAD-dependent SIR2 family protein deacetylase
MEQETGFKDRVVECVDCHDRFLFEAGEQRFYQGKGLAEPKRCPSCRHRRKLTINPGGERR